MSDTAPRAPIGAKSGGRALWREVVSRFELDQHELVLLREIVRCTDLLDDLDAVVRREGLMTEDGRVHSAAVEARQVRIVLPRLIASLRLPSEDETGRPQRRGAARGSYNRAIRGLTVAT